VLDESAPTTPGSSARTELAELETIQLAFEGPQATLELHIVDAMRKQPVPEVTITLSAGRQRIPVGETGQEILSWETLTEPGNPPIADVGGRIAFRVPAGLALGVEISGTWVRTEQRRHELAALAPDEKRTEVIEVATEDDLQFFGEAVDGATNAPLEGVEIQLERRPAIEPIATSDARGRFDLRTNSWESRNASASKRGFARLAFEVDGMHDSESRAQRLVLTQAATVQGFYHDCDDKPPAEGSLRFWTDSGFAAHVYPGDNGWFVADSLPTGEAVKVDFELEHRPIVRAVASVVLAPAEVRRIDWNLPQRHPLHGIVLDELGTPVKGCEVALYFGSPRDLRCPGASQALDERDSTTTDEEGRFRFAHASPGTWVIGLPSVRVRTWWAGNPYSWPGPLAARNVTVSGPDTEEVLLHCWRHTTLQGRVVDPDDRPVPGSTLRIQLVGCDGGVERPIGHDGTFVVFVPGPDTYELSVPGRGWYLDSEKITARGGEHGLVLKLKRAPLLRVRVVDERTQEPVQAQVFGIGTSAAGEESSSYDDTDEQGLFVRPRAAGKYRLFARSLDDRCGTLDGVVVDADSSAREWTVSVAPAQHALVHSSSAGGLIEVYFTWNGIAVGQEEIAQGSKFLLSIPPGTLSARYRREEPVGDWHTLDTSIGDPRLADIDLPFP
jgi:hypothetical protein